MVDAVTWRSVDRDGYWYPRVSRYLPHDVTDTGLKEALEADLATGTLTVGRSGVDER
jgi:hypothetical protein